MKLAHKNIQKNLEVTKIISEENNSPDLFFDSKVRKWNHQVYNTLSSNQYNTERNNLRNNNTKGLAFSKPKLENQHNFWLNISIFENEKVW